MIDITKVWARAPAICLSAVILCAAISGAACGLAGYRRGVEKNRGFARGGWKGGFVATLSALEAFDQGQDREGIGQVRNYCYATAVTLLEGTEARDDRALQTLLPELRLYLAKHGGTNQLGGSPVEQRLRTLLSVSGRRNRPPAVEMMAK